MRSRLIVCLLAVASACTPSEVAPPSSTTAPPTTTTTARPVPVVTPTGCSAPAVPFSLLCEITELVADQHIDPPAAAILAAAATAGANQTPGSGLEELPAEVRCAVPAVEFASMCEAIESRLRSDPAPLEVMIESAVEHLLNELDPYSRYVPPELAGDLDENGVISGAGIVIEARNVADSPCVLIGPECPLRVAWVIAGGSGEAAGIQTGDEIIAVDGIDTVEKTVSEVASQLILATGSTDVTLLRQEAPMTVTLTLSAEALLPVSSGIAGDVGYLRLYEFGFDSHLFVHEALDHLIDAGARRLILDLRDNPGGYLFSASIIGSEFVADGLLYRTIAPAETREFPAVEGGIATAMPVIVVANENSASSAEILAAALQERGRATLVGFPSFGKNLVQESFELRNGGLLRLTTAEWTTPSGASVAGIGVQPDVTLEIPRDLALEDLVAAVLEAVD